MAISGTISRPDARRWARKSRPARFDSATGITTRYTYKPYTNYVQTETSVTSTSSVVNFNNQRSRITDQKFRVSGDLFIDHYSLIIERSADAHGSTRIMTDATGKVVEDMNYDAFGNAIGFDASTALTTYLYSSMPFDAASGNYYDHARYFDTGTGSFTQADYGYSGSLANPMTGLPYTFTGDDPVNLSDLNGHGFSLPSVVMNIAIGSLFSAIISPVIAPFASDAAALLIPPALMMALETVGAPDAIELGVSGAAGGQYHGLGGFGTGGLELLASPHTGNDALYGYAGGGLSFSAGFGTGGTAGLAGSIGAVWSTPLSRGYTRSFWTLSVPFGALPARARAHIIQDLAAGAVSKNPFSPGGLVGLNPGLVSEDQLLGLENAYKNWNWLLKRLDSLTLNVFASSPGDFQQSWGVSFSMDVVGGSTSGTTPNLFSVGWSYYWQLAPSGNAVFA